MPAAARWGRTRDDDPQSDRLLVASGTFAHLRMDVEFTPSAHPMDRNSRTRLVSCNPAEGILGAAHGRAVDGQNEVAGLQSRLLRGAAHIQVADQYAALGETVLRGLLV